MPSTGHFILHSNVMPAITAGRYELLTEQTGVPFGVEQERTHVDVAAPRYVMPTDQILSSFPPANAEGAFGDRLPQIVLKRRTLPWERNPAGQVDPSPTPWLALVVVAEGEAELSAPAAVAECVTHGTTLLDPDDKDVEQGLYLAVTETVVHKIFPCEQDLALLTHVREVDISDTELANGDDDGWLAVVLANRLPVFDKANEKPVRYMACLVNVEGQLAALPQPTPPVETFEFSRAQDWRELAMVTPAGGPDERVLGNPAVRDLGVAMAGAPRAPRPAGVVAVPASGATAKSGVAFGKTLDGAASMSEPAVGTQWSQKRAATAQVAAAALDPDAKMLVRDKMALGFRLPIELHAQERVLRFPVLAHWSFTTNEGATFETLMQDLDVGLLGSVDELPPNTPAADAQPKLVETGHIDLSHRTRRGDPARAWYRGPCVPFPTPRDSVSKSDPLPLAHAADQLRRIIPDGREELSLAAAFEIGRLLALSQLSVVSALLRFRGEQFGAGRVREVLGELLPFELPRLATERIDLGRFVALAGVGLMVKSPEQTLGRRRPIADPGRPLRLKGDLDTLIARGLGLDPRALRKQAAVAGMVSALEQTAAPLGSKSGKAPDPKILVPALKATLSGSLERTFDVALPPSKRVVVPVTGKAAKAVKAPPGLARAAAPAPDALDRLMAEALPDDDTEETQ